MCSPERVGHGHANVASTELHRFARDDLGDPSSTRQLSQIAKSFIIEVDRS